MTRPVFTYAVVCSCKWLLEDLPNESAARAASVSHKKTGGQFPHLTAYRVGCSTCRKSQRTFGTQRGVTEWARDHRVMGRCSE